MTKSVNSFNLKVQRVEQFCVFELSWGRGQQISVTIPYPETLSALYQQWNADYLSFYNTSLRGRVAAKGSLGKPSVDWHAKLVESETKLLYEFHQWLRHAKLFEIRSCLAQAAKDGDRNSPNPHVEVFLSCNPMELAHLPWEAWEIGTEFAAAGKIRIFRYPLNIQGVTVTHQQRRRRARILAILGDDTGLNFQADKKAVRSLASVAEISFVGWQPGQESNALKTEIVKAITDERGWDVLLFAGHSDETLLTGGELAIAPGVCLQLKEIEKPLTIAKEKGLQFALFNSCKGISHANFLINLGLSQVAVMREKIHDQVAQEFLWRFLQCLGEYKDVHEALLSACKYLKLEKPLTYPSAYLIPSLFRHPDAPLFRIEPCGLKQKLTRWLPTKKEAISLAILGIVSWQLSIQNYLLEKRVLTQAIYRQHTDQIAATKTSPLLIVEIDDKSIIEAGIKSPTPMDRKYLSSLVNKLSEVKAKVVGIDYLLDRSHGKSDDSLLAKSLKKAVQKQQTWFVFAAIPDSSGKFVGVLPKIASTNWTLQGNMNLFVWQQRLGYTRLIPNKDASSRNLPLSYLMALAYKLNFEPNHSPPQPQLQPSQKDFLSQQTQYLGSKHKQDYTTLFSPALRLHPITDFAYGKSQMWLHPIIDFSIPPNQVYERIPAWKFLQMTKDSPELQKLDRQAVLIAAGGYGEKPGVQVGGEDVFPLPEAVGYWRQQQNPPEPRRFFTGGEGHAYIFQNFLTQRSILPIPDLWMIGLAGLLGKAITLALEKRQQFSRRWTVLLLVGFTGSYGLVSLQIYIWGAVLLPWLLPSLTLWVYLVPVVSRKKYHA
ncbi:MAG: CHASE2 domain-containing protein [Potamolinea sp.]